ncbi:serpin B6-like [Xiphophorus couchianus]|uniref:serpin B6-like n=1 Tax=Xiphophorus couchianus TaxID=32473 RepID=UPI001016FFA4|nr:serpin B6-like [Xiphophorus couchianus]
MTLFRLVFIPPSMRENDSLQCRIQIVTKPVQMMFQKNDFLHAYISEVRCQVINHKFAWYINYCDHQTLRDGRSDPSIYNDLHVTVKCFCWTHPGDALRRIQAEHAHLFTERNKRQHNRAKKSEIEINIGITINFNVVINAHLVSCQLEKHLTYEKLLKWTHPGNMKDTLVEVKLPQFKLEETYDLNKVLSSMGMVDAFDIEKSDFSGMTGDKELYLSSVSHKAFVEVNEKGTEAAASTQMRFRCGRSFLPRINIPISFTADHPFLFFIRHNPTKSILFAGRFCSP